VNFKTCESLNFSGEIYNATDLPKQEPSAGERE